MTEIQTTDSLLQPPPPVAPKPPGIFGTKIPSTLAFGIGILLFLLPFIDIRCNNMTLQTVSGMELATGFKIKSPGGDNSLFGKFENTTLGETKESSKNEKKDPNIFALVALSLGVLGLLLSFLNARAGGAGGLLTGVLSAASLIGLLIDIKGQVKKELLTGSGDLTGDVVVSVDFTAGFYLALLAFLGAAWFSFKRMKTNLK